MKNGICPKCGNATVYTMNNGVSFSPMSGVCFVRTGGATMASAATSYVCSRCGYFENYIADANKLTSVAKAWQKVSPPGS